MKNIYFKGIKQSVNKLRSIKQFLKKLIISIINYIIGFISAIRNFYLNFLNFLKFLVKKDLAIDDYKNNPIVVITSKNFNHGRYGYQLLNYLSLAGFNIVVYRSVGFLLHLKGYDRLIFQIPNLYFTFRKSKFIANKDSLLITINCENPVPEFEGKHLDVDFDFFNRNNHSDSMIEFPYFVHPLNHNKISIIQNDKVNKRGGVLFYGSNELECDNELLKNYFDILTRLEIFEILNFADLSIRKPNTEDELNILLSEGCSDKIVIIDSSLFWIKNWMQILKSFDFFIASPGYAMPVCHNIIEAMSVGTIPILQYSTYFNPSLQHEVNCLAFDSADSLIRQIKHGLSMKQEIRSELRKNVEKYYDNYINPKSFKVQLMSLDRSEYKLRFNAEELSLKYIQQNN